MESRVKHFNILKLNISFFNYCLRAKDFLISQTNNALRISMKKLRISKNLSQFM